MCTWHHAATLLRRCAAQLAAVVWFSKSLWCIYLIQTILLSFRRRMFGFAPFQNWLGQKVTLVLWRAPHFQLFPINLFTCEVSQTGIFWTFYNSHNVVIKRNKKIGQLMNRLPWEKMNKWARRYWNPLHLFMTTDMKDNQILLWLFVFLLSIKFPPLSDSAPPLQKLPSCSAFSVCNLTSPFDSTNPPRHHRHMTVTSPHFSGQNTSASLCLGCSLPHRLRAWRTYQIWHEPSCNPEIFISKIIKHSRALTCSGMQGH